MKSISLALLGTLIASQAPADEAGHKRMQDARNAMLEISANSMEFVGRKFEGVCPIASIDTNFMTCLVMNKSGEIVGSKPVAISDMRTAQSVPLLNECNRDTSSDDEIKPRCIVYFRGRVDDLGVIYASESETASNFQ